MTTFAVYVEKELVGKHIKSSKVKVLWQLAFDEDYVVHQVELRHSIVSGKREIMFDNQPVYANKALFQGTFEHRSKLAGHDVRVTVEDTFEGYLYDLIVDNVAFHRMPRKTLNELEKLRADKKNGGAPAVQVDFASFTGKSKSALDGEASPKKKEKKKEKAKEDESLIELDWDAAVKVQVPRQAPQPQQAQFNPFDSTFAAPQQQQPSYAYDPFAAPANQSTYPSYAMPSAIPPAQQSFQQPQQYYGAPPAAQQQAYDPFSSFAQPPPQYYAQQPQQQQRPPQQQQPYDPFA